MPRTSAASSGAPRQAASSTSSQRTPLLRWTRPSGSARTLAVTRSSSRRSRKDRPGLTRALAAIDAGEADCVVVSRLDRLSRSVSHFASLLERYPRGIVPLDLGIDPASIAGEFTATIIAAVGQMERRLTGQRTREALQAARERGVKLGRPREVSEIAISRIMELSAAGVRPSEIARVPNR